jgi:hypothetical protein
MTDRELGGRQILVTGCYRSGTTLVEKLLHAHPQICVGAQAFPPLFAHSMDAFHRSLGITRRYPLGHLFGETAYGLANVEAFLETLKLSDDDLDQIFDTLPTDDEQYDSAGLAPLRGEIRPGSFVSVFAQLSGCIARLHGAAGAELQGTKEILCEAYLPFLIHQGHAGVVIVRDPRDVVASTHFRTRGDYTGAQRPVLSTIRLWRKSVALLLELEGQQRFAGVRYEDLISDPRSALNDLTRQLGVAPYSAALLEKPIRDQSGRVWKANSSFDPASEADAGLQSSSIANFERHVPEQVTAYVETLCRPEMLHLGYQPRLAHDFDPERVAAYRDMFPSVHERFDANYSSDPSRIRAEIERWDALCNGEEDPVAIRARFLSKSAYEALSSTVAANRDL